MAAQKSHTQLWLIASLTALLAVATTTPGWAQSNGKQEAGEGKYADLTATWWAWVFAQPAVPVGGTNTNPVLDTTGTFATAGQENGIGPADKYFFLAGTFGGAVTRTVTVPKGKALFFPIVNFETDNDNAPPTNNTVPQLRALAAANIDSIPVGSLFARLNGEPVAIFRTKSPTFSYTLPDQNSLYVFFGLPVPILAGTVKPVVADGYWAFIPPLPSGFYVLEFGSLPSNQDNTYHLTIP
jgi:hypothetical protein